MVSKSESFKFANWLQDFCKDNEDPYIRSSEGIIADCLDFDKKIPEKYGWRFSSKESLDQQISALDSVTELNRIYWKDQARNVEAYSVMTFWRGIELLKPAIRSLNAKEFTTPAVLARSLMELATAFILQADRVDKIFSTLSFNENTIVVSKEFEEAIVKAIWGTRLGKPEPHVSQTNVLTLLEKISKQPQAKNVLPVYEYLCEIAHPNVIGNIRFWSHVEKINDDGSELRVLYKHTDQETVGVASSLEKTLWSLSWSSVCLKNSFMLNSNAIKQLDKKLKLL